MEKLLRYALMYNMSKAKMDEAFHSSFTSLGAQMPEEKKVVVANIERHGTAVIVPQEMDFASAIEVLSRAAEAEEKKIEQSATMDAHPYDVAWAFGKAIKEVCGYLMGKETWFSIPEFVNVEVAPGEFVQVLWGKMVFPLDPEKGVLMATYQKTANGTAIGKIAGVFKQKYSHVWSQIVAATKVYLQKESLFKGRTLRVRFLDNDGDAYAVPQITPWNVSGMKMEQLVFPAEIAEQVEDHILTPIRYKAECESAGTPFKRGILLAGPYGCGKTLLAGAVANEASQKGMTVIYIENVKELPLAIRMATQLAPAVVFAEDIDRVMGGDRTHEVDVLLNTLDGIDTKNAPVMTVLTSNYPKNIYKGMVRPGRIDVALQIGPPDSAAAAKLVKLYLGDMFADENGDLEEMGNSLQGFIPAVIGEVCQRSKLSYISRTGKRPHAAAINADDVIRATGSMKNQLSLLNGDGEVTPDPVGDFLQRFRGAVEHFPMIPVAVEA